MGKAKKNIDMEEGTLEVGMGKFMWYLLFCGMKFIYDL